MSWARTRCRSPLDLRTTSRRDPERTSYGHSRKSGHYRSTFHPAIRSIAFCACYIYSPRGERVASEGSRILCSRLKSSDPEWLPRYAGDVYEEAIQHGRFSGLFGREVVLIPVPGSAPSTGASWAAERLAMTLKEIGLAYDVWTGLYRRFAVRKSATAFNGDRPTVEQHYDSFAVERPSRVPDRIVLVDDVITKGRTLLAAAARLYEAFPNADLRAFALVRTMGLVSEVTHLREPCEGVVRWAGGDARREP